MDSKKSIPYLLAIIILLSICFALSIGYIIGTSTNKSIEQVSPSPTENKVTNDIEELKTIYNSEIEEKTATYKELENEKLKVQELMVELEKSKTEEQTLLKYKNQYQNLENKMRLLVDEISVLKSNKSEAVTNASSSKSKNVTVKKRQFNLPASKTVTTEKSAASVKNETSIITSEPQTPVKKSEYVAKELTITNLKALGYKIKSATKNEVSDIATKVDFIKITFTVDVNTNEKASEKKYYIQVIDSKNNILGRKITEYLDDKTLTYSTQKDIVYDNENIQIEYDLTADSFEKGTYSVNIFDRSKLVAKTSFTLR